MLILVSHCFHHLSEILYRIYLCTSFAYNRIYAASVRGSETAVCCVRV